MARSTDPLEAAKAPTGVKANSDAYAPLSAHDMGKPAQGTLPKPPPGKAGEKVKYYRVQANADPRSGGAWKPQIRGMVTSLYTGKVLRSSSYDIEDLKRQGVQLEEVPPPPLATG